MIKKLIPLKIKTQLKIIIKFCLIKKNTYFNKRKLKKINTNQFLIENIKKVKSIEELIYFHFDTYSVLSHINRDMFTLVLNHFSGKSLNILETGSAAHGSKSSMLFAGYVIKFGGSFNTVDINPDIKSFYEFIENKNVKFHTYDSVDYIEKLEPSYLSKLDIVFLDSVPIDLKFPHSAQNHVLKEFLLVDAHVKKGTIVAIDDTPNNFELWGTNEKNNLDFIPGNGRYVLDYLEENKGTYEILYHHYSVVLKKL
tara:strand:- start:154 stop:915 length:762 start_codon:yes stop_codon:yes gene_type:complete